MGVAGTISGGNGHSRPKTRKPWDPGKKDDCQQTKPPRKIHVPNTATLNTTLSRLALGRKMAERAHNSGVCVTSVVSCFTTFGLQVKKVCSFVRFRFSPSRKQVADRKFRLLVVFGLWRESFRLEFCSVFRFWRSFLDLNIFYVGVFSVCSISNYIPHSKHNFLLFAYRKQ